MQAKSRRPKMQNTIGEGCPLALIGGPCVIESEAFTVKKAEGIRQVCDRLHIPFRFKSSFDKANRTSIASCAIAWPRPSPTRRAVFATLPLTVPQRT